MIIKKGAIVKISGNKTVKVEVNEYRAHPKYKKRYRITKRFLVHDENNVGQVGEQVSIQQNRQISKRKSWILIDDKK